MSEEQDQNVSSPTFECLEFHKEGATLWVTMNRPKAKNALNRKMIEELELLVEQLKPRLDIRILVLRGSGRHFCAGGDVKEMFVAKMTEPKEGEPDPIAALNRLFGRVISTLYEVPQTLIVAVEGAAMGGGLGLVCVADIVIATKTAQFKLPETSLGLVPAQIAPFLLERLGLAKTRKLALTGASLNGEEAEREGLVDICCVNRAAMDEEIRRLRRQMLKCAPEASRNTKKLILDLGRRNLEKALDEGATIFAAAVRSDEGREGISAFTERRPVKWSEDVWADVGEQYLKTILGHDGDSK